MEFFRVCLSCEGLLLCKFSLPTEFVKSWKHDFEITGYLKGPPIESNFWSSFEAPNP